MSVNPGGPMLPTDSPLPFNPGGPMVPETPIPEPTPTPMSVEPGGPLKPPHRRAPGNSCTWTTSETVPYPCSFNGIETVYPSIATSTRHVDCHGCQDIHVDKQIWYCPVQLINATHVAHTPKTTWTTACATVATSGQVTARDAAPVVVPQVPAPTAQPTPEAQRRNPQGNLMDQQPAACPTTYLVQPGKSAGSTSTRYQQTVTSTVRLPCGGCQLVLSTALAGYGPAGRFTTTVTAPVGTSTTYVCQ
ncbi:hypothetical protein CONLIGDRAFT_678433 [Coniochaeta ligniaria NRRL 30616]|uniref:Uncharacterized protein n=1 Tax=Coniochaeta ligniaria NRRL 30616 TaxID=1408157 RepID=A0A1J7IWX8_9PEZI|nr:hypothetical protein CONLIGDRAFT_678433 [Coniochaeta ligniaria NRRL 30616]